MAASNKPTAVHFVLIFFVLATVVAVIWAVVTQKDYNALNTELAQVKKTNGELDGANRNYLDQIAELKKVIGHEFPDVGVQDPQNQNTVLGAARADLQRYAGSQPAPTYTAALASLQQERNSAITDRETFNTQIEGAPNPSTGQLSGGLKQDLLALNGTYTQMANTHKKAAEDAEKNLREVETTQKKLLDEKQQKIDGLIIAVNEARRTLDQEREQAAAAIKERDDKNELLAKNVDKLREDLNSIRRVSFERPDGLIRWVDHQTRTVWINLGSEDGLQTRTLFSVYKKENDGVGRVAEEGAEGDHRGLSYEVVKDRYQEVKGSIEVTEIQGPHRAQCTIKEASISSPISIGDPVYTPLWAPGRTESFAFVGLMDIDGDGQSDRDTLHSLLRSANAKIDVEVGDDGEYLVDDGMTTNTKFLVIGQIPDPQEVPPNEREAAESMSGKHSALQDKARETGVMKVRLYDFLSYMGYTPAQRLWRPGEQIEWTLKSGASSTGVNETLGDRSSTGSTSGVFSRSKRLKQPTSTGNTAGQRGGY